MLTKFLISTLRPLQFRGKIRLLNALTPDQGEQVIRLFGYQVRLNLKEDMQRLIYQGAFEPQETGWVIQRLKPGSTFLDVGANIGYFSLLAASRVGVTGRVIAVEPSPYVYQRLATTIAENHIPNIDAYNYGLSDEPGQFTLYMPPATDRNHSPTVVPNEGWTPCELPVKRLDDCLAEWGVDSIDLMKLDAEGHENAILDGASEVLASGRIRSLFCEFNDYYLRETGGSPQELYNRLIGLGFRDVEGPHVFEADCMINRLFQFEGQPRL